MKVQVAALNFSDYPGLELVDTTGAGDTFTAAFAVKLSEVTLSKGTGQEAALNAGDYQQCLLFATRAAFLCISRFGATPAIPTRSEVEELALP